MDSATVGTDGKLIVNAVEVVRVMILRSTIIGVLGQSRRLGSFFLLILSHALRLFPHFPFSNFVISTIRLHCASSSYLSLLTVPCLSLGHSSSKITTRLLGLRCCPSVAHYCHRGSSLVFKRLKGSHVLPRIVGIERHSSERKYTKECHFFDGMLTFFV